MAVGMMFQALQYAAKKSGYLLLHTDDGYAVADTVKEKIVCFEDDLDEVADLLGGLAVYTAEQRRHHDCEEMVDVFDEDTCRKVDEKYIHFKSLKPLRGCRDERRNFMLLDSLIKIANHIGMRLFSNDKGDRFILVDDEGNSSPIFKDEDKIAAYLSDYIVNAE